MKWANLMKAPTTTKHGPFTYFYKASRRINGRHAPNIFTFQFTDEQTALSFFNLIKERLPLLNSEYPKIDQQDVHLTKEESLFFLRLVMCESGQLNTSYLDDSLLKTLRADEFDFSYQFIMGIIPGEKNERRLQNLRPNQRKPITISPNGTITSRSNKKAMYSAKEKEGFSQIQSNTLLDPNALSSAFGFSRGLRNSKLYGIITHTEDALFNRLLTDDSGTVVRIFDFDSEKTAETSLTRLKDRVYSPSQIKEFRKANHQARQNNSRTNEVLTRIRFNPYRSVVCICADTLEARLLAYDFAHEILDHYRLYAQNIGLTLNPNFKVPIIFYVANENYTSRNRHTIKLYTEDMRRKDEAEAIIIFNDPISRVEHYKRNDFEFLLGLPEITPEILLDECLGKPLAYIMLENGYTRMLMRLLRNKSQAENTQESSRKSSLRETVFKALINHRPYLFKQYDPIISRLVLAEQFDLAGRLITETGSKKESLVINADGYYLLKDYVLSKGTPRQVEFFDLEKMILEAARRSLWVTVKLCLKEFPNIGLETLKQLSLTIEENRDICTSAFLAQTQPDSAEFLNRHLSTATSTEDWDQIIELVRNSYSLLDQHLLGRALFQAIRNKNVRAPKFLLRFNIRNPAEGERSGYRIAGCLFDALTNGLIELISDLIELERRSHDEFAPVRFLVALELAHEIGNPETIALFEKNRDLACATDPENIKKAICFLVICALSDSNTDLAEKRLLRLCHKYQLLPLENQSIYDAFKIIIVYLNLLANSSWGIHSEFLIPYLTSLFLKHQDTDNLRVIINDNDNQRGHMYYESRISVCKSLLSQLTHHNFAFIKEFSETFINQSSINWKQQLIRAYEDAARGEKFDEDKAFLLFEMGLEFLKHDFSLVFKEAITRGGIKVAKYIFEHPKVNEEIMDQLTEVLVKNPNSINLFESQLKNKVKPCHIKQFSSLHPFDKAGQLATLLNLVDLNKYHPEDYLWEFYSAFTFNLSTDFIVMDTLSELLTPSIMRHMMLIFVVYMFRAIDLFRDEIEKPIESCRWPKLAQAIEANDQLHKMCWYQTKNFVRLNSHHTETLDILNSYCLDINQLQDPELTCTTFSRVLQLFSGAVSKNRVIIPFYEIQKPVLPEFNKIIYTLMRSLDQKLKAFEHKISHKDENDSSQLNEVNAL